uniref:Uncharacterized protein n=1 Tax=Micrurus paraensis TaxID=1970185 RepID=A0A2D4KJH4_9SAUR
MLEEKLTLSDSHDIQNYFDPRRREKSRGVFCNICFSHLPKGCKAKPIIQYSTRASTGPSKQCDVLGASRENNSVLPVCVVSLSLLPRFYYGTDTSVAILALKWFN